MFHAIILGRGEQTGPVFDTLSKSICERVPLWKNLREKCVSEIAGLDRRTSEKEFAGLRLGISRQRIDLLTIAEIHHINVIRRHPR